MKVSLIPVFDRYINERRGQIKDSSLETMSRLKKKVELFEKKKRRTVYLQDCTTTWFEEFLEVLSDSGCCNTTIRLYSTVLMSFFEELRKSGAYNLTINYEAFKYCLRNYKRSKSNFYLLTDLEVADIWKCPNLTPKQEIIKDYFIFQTQTGLRWSDVNRLQKKHFTEKDGKLYINDFSTKKTGTVMYNHIIKKYRLKFNDLADQTFIFTETFTTQNVVNHLKRVAKKAKLNNEFICETRLGKKTKITKYKLHEKLGTHMARHHFASVFMSHSTDIYLLMKVLGHKTINTTEKYVHDVFGFIPDNITNELDEGKMKMFELT